jgi:ammonium transporter, Amt family
MVLGPRIGKFNKDGSANTIPGHNIPMGVLGTIILYGFNPGSSLSVVTPAVLDQGGNVTTAASLIPINLTAVAAVNTLLAGVAGGVSAMTYMWLFGPTKKPSPGLSVNGILAGLVAITAPCWQCRRRCVFTHKKKLTILSRLSQSP